MSRDDADAFCQWLTARELAASHLRAGQRYRLPTDREWSRAAGLPDEPGDTPEARDGHVRGVYPWGKQWPPPPDAGNFADPQGGKHARKPRRHRRAAQPTPRPLPWAALPPTIFGLYDMAGNVWQWCADNYKSNGALRHWGVLRGGSWADYGPSILQSQLPQRRPRHRARRDLRVSLRDRSSSSRPMTFPISRIILFVADVPKVAAFYQRHFGLEPLGPAEEGWLELRAGGCNLAFHHGKLTPGKRSKSPAKIVFAVTDVREAVDHFAASGLKFGKIHEWNGISFADAKDPEGNSIQISSRETV